MIESSVNYYDKLQQLLSFAKLEVVILGKIGMLSEDTDQLNVSSSEETNPVITMNNVMDRYSLTEEGDEEDCYIYLMIHLFQDETEIDCFTFYAGVSLEWTYDLESTSAHMYYRENVASKLFYLLQRLPDDILTIHKLREFLLVEQEFDRKRYKEELIIYGLFSHAHCQKLIAEPSSYLCLSFTEEELEKDLYSRLSAIEKKYYLSIVGSDCFSYSLIVPSTKTKIESEENLSDFIDIGGNYQDFSYPDCLYLFSLYDRDNEDYSYRTAAHLFLGFSKDELSVEKSLAQFALLLPSDNPTKEEMEQTLTKYARMNHQSVSYLKHAIPYNKYFHFN